MIKLKSTHADGNLVHKWTFRRLELAFGIAINSYFKQKGNV